MVSYQKSVVKYSMEVFGNATKSYEKFRCFDENRAWPFLFHRERILNAVFRCVPSRENGIAERPQTLRYPEIKIICPLNMARAQRKPFSIVLHQKGTAAWVWQFLGSRYYALWDVGCVWKSTVMGDQPTRRSKSSLTHLKLLVTSLPLLSRTVKPMNFPVLSVLGFSVYLLSFAS